MMRERTAEMGYAGMMKPTNLLLMLLLMSSPCLADIYKSVDGEGNVIFGDTPPDEDAEQYVPGDTNTITLPKWSPAEEAEAPEKAFRYSTLRILSPQSDELVLSNSFEVNVTIALTPALKDGHSITVNLDGNKAVQNSRELQHRFSTGGPGPHEVSVEIYEGSNLIQQSEAVSFFSRRRTLAGANVRVGPRDALGNVYTPGPEGVYFKPGPVPAPIQSN